MPSVDSALFRQLLGRFATGVTIITSRDARGKPAGMTANSLASVSLHPPLVSVCVEHAADMYACLQQADAYVFNILTAGQEGLSRRFAVNQPQKFNGIGYRLTPSGLVILDGVLAYIECRRVAEYPAGDHTVFLGEVVDGATYEGEPLLYYRGGYAEIRR